MHVLYLFLHHQCVVFQKVHTRKDYVLKQIGNGIFESLVLPPKDEVMEQKSS